MQEIKQGVVHIWKADLNDYDNKLEKFENIIDEEEKEKACRLKSIIKRRCFIASRGILRLLLSEYIGIDPENIKFRYNLDGKPEILCNLMNLQFNISHSENIALFAFAMDSPIGVDIEKLDKEVKFNDIALRYYSTEEYKTITELPKEKGLEQFFKYWTRKEAYIKARGKGIWQLLDKIEIISKIDIEPIILKDNSNPDEIDKWFIYDLYRDFTGKDFVAAIAVKTKVDHLDYRLYF
jgi:4'-phosphopantetheinyl transferase